MSGNHAYVADSDSGVRIIDVSNPAVPIEVGFNSTGVYAVGVAVSGTHVYIAQHDLGFRILDVSDPAAPVEVGFRDTLGLTRAVVVSGDLAYVANGHSGLSIIDVSNPAAPTLRVASLPSTSKTRPRMGVAAGEVTGFTPLILVEEIDSCPPSTRCERASLVFSSRRMLICCSNCCCC